MALSDYFKFWNAKDATALTTDIRSAETAYVDSGKLTGVGVYEPGKMQFNGSSCFLLTGAPSYSGNAYSAIVRVRNCVNSSNAYIFAIDHGAAARDTIIVNATSHRPDFYIYDSTGTLKDQLIGTGVDLGDGEEHILLLAVDGATGAACFYDGHTQLDTGAIGAFTLGSGGGNATVGAWHTGATSFVPANTEISYFGYRRAYIDWTVEANRLKFLTANGHLKQINESSWTEWGAQPEFWNPRAQMTDNRGSYTNFNWVKDVKLLVGTDVVPTFPLPTLGNCRLWLENKKEAITGSYNCAAVYPTGGLIVLDPEWSTVLSAANFDLDAEGLAWNASTGYADMLRCNSGPALPSGARKFEMWGKLNIASTNDCGLFIAFNMADVSTDYWLAGLRWVAASNLYRLAIAERTASVTTNRGTADFATTTTVPGYAHLTAYCLGDTVWATATIWEYDTATDQETKSLIYNVASRPNKTATGVKFSGAAAGADAKIRGFKITDLAA